MRLKTIVLCTAGLFTAGFVTGGTFVVKKEVKLAKAIDRIDIPEGIVCDVLIPAAKKTIADTVYYALYGATPEHKPKPKIKYQQRYSYPYGTPLD